MTEALAFLERRVLATGGVATRSQLHDVSQWTLRRAVTEGVLVRDTRGAYAVPQIVSDARAARRLSGALSHLSAALAHGWSVAHTPRPQIVVPRGRRLRLPVGDCDVRWRAVSTGELQRGVTDPLATVVDCACDLPFPEALAVADAALRDGLTKEDLRDATAGLQRPGSRKAALVARFADPGAENAFESALRAHCLQIPGLTPRTQVTIGEGDTAARVDVGDKELRIAVEADSFAWHGQRDQLHRDATRYNEIVILDWLLLRATWEAVFDGSGALRRWLRGAVFLRRGRAVPPALVTL